MSHRSATIVRFRYFGLVLAATVSFGWFAVADETPSAAPKASDKPTAKPDKANVEKAKDDEAEVAQPGTKDESKPRSLFDGKSLGDWKESGFPTQGRVKVEDGRIVIGFGEGCSGITYKGKFPTTNYELSLEAMRVDGSDFFCGLTFPVQPAADHPRRDKEKKDEVWPCTLILGGWGGGVVGLSSVDGHDASENATSSYKEFESGKWYKVRVRVTEKKIEAWLDKEKVVDLTVGDRQLSIRLEVEESKPLGIATWRTTGAVKNIAVTTVKEPDSPPEIDDR
ncbi:MAG: DUF1080 domain-containing protein [Planctomycetota bacterium]|nr:MAG: DUF1080 domain-containing protein [Planctomycetota bacterium]